LMASFSTVMFNANPLMRFDGYYVLSDLIGVPNLYTVAQQYWNYAIRRYLLGMKSSLPVMTPGRETIIRVYSVASWFWRVTICISLVVGASVLFHGAGALLAMGAVVAWVGPWIIGTVAQLSNRAAPISWLRFGSLMVAMCGAVVAAFWCDWPCAHRATGIVQYAEVAQVRAPVAGFVDKLFVKDGEVVKRGAPIARLRNEQLNAELADLILAQTQSNVRLRVYERTKELGKAAEEEEVLQSLQHRIETSRQQVDELTIRAVEGGRVMRKNLEAVLGVYAREGDLIAAIVHDDSKELVLTVAQDDVEHLSGETNGTVHFLPNGRGMVDCLLTQVDPRASTQPIHNALCSSNGGSLAVRSTLDGEGTKIELLNPHFKGVATIPKELNDELLVGHRGSVYIENHGHSIAFHLYRRFSAWIDVMAGRVEA
ncbi:MAG: putative peptide zinc metalloprotease protein, partial [Pirellulaceae bacterium]